MSQVDELGAVNDEYGKTIKRIQDMGIAVEDESGNLLDSIDILKNVGNEWDTLDEQQQKYIASGLGVYQLNRFSALVKGMKGEASEYNRVLGIAYNSTGSMEKKYLEYSDSIEAANARMIASWEALYIDTINSGFVKSMYNAGDSILTFIKNGEVLQTLLVSLSALVLGLTAQALSPIAIAFLKAASTAGVLNATLATTQVLLGGLALSAGLAVGAIAGLIIYSNLQKQKQEELWQATLHSADAFYEQSEQVNSLVTSISDLNGVTKLGSDDQARLNGVAENLVKTFPILAGKVDMTKSSYVDLANAAKYATEMMKYAELQNYEAQDRMLLTNINKMNETYQKSKTSYGGGEQTSARGELITGINKQQLDAERAKLSALRVEKEKLKNTKLEFPDIEVGAKGTKGNVVTGDSDKGSKEKEKSILDNYKAQASAVEDINNELTILNSKLQLSEGDERIAAQEAIISATKRHQEALRSYNIELRKIKNPTEEVTAEMTKNSQAWWADQVAIKNATDAIKDYNKEAQDLIEKKLSDVIDKATSSFDGLSDVIDDSIDSIDDEIDSLKRKQDALDAEYDRKKLLLEVEEARAKLANVQAERNVKLYTGQGITGWEFVADPQEVQSAQESLNDAKEKLYEFDVEASQKAEIQKLEDEKKALQERKQEFEKFQKNIETAMKNHEEITSGMLNGWLSSLSASEQESYALRIEQVKTFVADYNAQLAQLKGALGTEEFYAGSGDIQDRGGGRKTDDPTADAARDNYLRENPSAKTAASLDKAKPKAIGGPVNAGQMYRVNENGMESMLSTINGKDYLTPLTNGKILTAPQTNKALSGGMSNNQPSFVIENLTVQANNSNELISSLKMRANLISPIK